MQKAQNFGQKLIQNPITQSKKTGKSIYFKAHAKSMRINTYRRETERERKRMIPVDQREKSERQASSCLYPCYWIYPL